MTPATGATASEGSRTGSIAVPGPTMAPEKTGSGTAASPMARPARGDVTLVKGSLPGVEIHYGPSLPVPDGTLLSSVCHMKCRFRARDVGWRPWHPAESICACSERPCTVVLLLEAE
ncbi:hypothetical protein GCM10009540_07510 [Streptomyces turgidiscabies]